MKTHLIKTQKQGAFSLHRKAFSMFLFLINIFIQPQVYNVKSIITICNGTPLHISDSTFIYEQKPDIYISKNTFVHGWSNKKDEKSVCVNSASLFPQKKSVLVENAIKKEVKIIFKAKSASYVAAFKRMPSQRFESNLASEYQTAIIPITYNIQKLFNERVREIFWSYYLSFIGEEIKLPYKDIIPLSGILNPYISRPPPNSI